jgi:hypothetical protein
MVMQIATGFELQPLADGNVLVEFHDDDGETLNSQIVTAEVVASMPIVANLTGLTLTQELDAIKAMLGGVGGSQKVPDGR